MPRTIMENVNRRAGPEQVLIGRLVSWSGSATLSWYLKLVFLGRIALLFFSLYTQHFIYLLKRQHNYTQKNENENLTNQQHKTLKRYLAHLHYLQKSHLFHFWNNSVKNKPITIIFVHGPLRKHDTKFAHFTWKMSPHSTYYLVKFKKNTFRSH